ncbi:hypothetical protein [Paenibacillus sp. 1781tsa1]|uniref:hypothetical protein n=1 Tax=Paenibacillus sp. 1781tsa1 TaxID=2953810 RepID=UPI00209E0DD2|nr:hypothetical protein [Paenibacillus sp. 1781tsa1]MCP1184995.1 hypothetical protein [Paenibacillus sp. 1781tsa1]
MSNLAERMQSMLIQYITDATQLGEPLSKVIVENSTFSEMLKEDLDFVGHYSLEYWADQVLGETVDRLRNALDSLDKLK